MNTQNMIKKTFIFIFSLLSLSLNGKISQTNIDQQNNGVNNIVEAAQAKTPAPESTTFTSIIIAAINAYKPKAKLHALFDIPSNIKDKISSYFENHEVNQEARAILESYVPKEMPVKIPRYEGKVTQEEIYELFQDVIFEIEVPISIIQGTIKKQLKIWDDQLTEQSDPDCATDEIKEIESKIKSAEYVLANIKRIEFGLRFQKWLSNGKKSTLKSWVLMLPVYNKFNEHLEIAYRALKTQQEDPEDDLSGEEVLDMVFEHFSTFLKSQTSDTETDSQHFTKEIIEDIIEASKKTHALYENAFKGISESGPEKEAHITDLVLLLEELFKEGDSFGQHIESGFNAEIKQLERKVKRSQASEEDAANLAKLKTSINAIKINKIVSNIIDFILSSKTTPCIMIKKALSYEEEDSLAMRLAKRFI
jgi:hypothetical protein